MTDAHRGRTNVTPRRIAAAFDRRLLIIVADVLLQISRRRPVANLCSRLAINV